jgi:WD40 repeat protein
MTLLAYPVDLTLTIYDFQSKSKTILEQPSDLRDGFKSSYELSEISPAYQFLRFDPNNSYLVALYFQPPLNYILRFWDLRTKKVIRDISIPFSVDDIQLAPDGKSIYLLSDGLVRILQIKQ